MDAIPYGHAIAWALAFLAGSRVILAGFRPGLARLRQEAVFCCDVNTRAAIRLRQGALWAGLVAASVGWSVILAVTSQAMARQVPWVCALYLC